MYLLTSLISVNQFADLERALLRNSNLPIAQDWPAVLERVVARGRDRDLTHFFRTNAAFAQADLYEFPESER
jgi:hypothetical protein